MYSYMTSGSSARWCRIRSWSNTVLALSVAALITGCGQSASTTTTRAEAPEPGRLNASMFPPGTWPLTVRAGVVRCEDSSVIFKTGGTDYTVNGTALTRHQDMHPIRGIWRASRDIPGTRIDISPVLDAGLKLCR